MVHFTSSRAPHKLRRLALPIAALVLLAGLGLLFLELLPSSQIREGLTRSLLLAALLVAWPFAGALGRPRHRR